MRHASTTHASNTQRKRSRSLQTGRNGVANLRIRPTARDLEWLAHIHRHGPQSSRYLYELTRKTHVCLDSSLRRLQSLRRDGLLSLPNQQRQTIHADFNPYIYDISETGRDVLLDHEYLENTIRPAGHWWHGYLTSCVTSTIEMSAKAQDISYIATHEILARQNTPLAIQTGKAKLIPDQLFALNYGGAFRAFMLEVDRGTEPKLSTTRRKSYARSIALYDQILTGRLYHTHYGLKANLLVLWVFNKRSNEARFLELVEHIAPRSSAAILTKTIEEAALVREPQAQVFDEPWLRAKGEPVYINRV